MATRDHAYCHCSHFPAGTSEAQRGYMACSKLGASGRWQSTSVCPGVPCPQLVLHSIWSPGARGPLGLPQLALRFLLSLSLPALEPSSTPSFWKHSSPLLPVSSHLPPQTWHFCLCFQVVCGWWETGKLRLSKFSKWKESCDPET